MNIYQVSNSFYDLENAIIQAFQKRADIMKIELNSNRGPELFLRLNYWTKPFPYLTDKDGNYSELNPAEIKPKWDKQMEKEKKEKEIKDKEKEIKDKEMEIQRGKEKYHIVVLSNSPNLRVDKWIHTREDFLEVFNHDKSLFLNRNPILSKFATDSEIIEIINESKLVKSWVEYYHKLIDLCIERNIDYDRYYHGTRARFNDGTMLKPEEQQVTIPYQFLMELGIESFIELIEKYKFDLNKDVNYGGPIPFHALGYFDNEEFIKIMKACIKAGYDINTVESESGMIIAEAISSFMPDLADQIIARVHHVHQVSNIAQ